jgi:hypothetical protein
MYPRIGDGYVPFLELGVQIIEITEAVPRRSPADLQPLFCAAALLGSGVPALTAGNETKAEKTGAEQNK